MFERSKKEGMDKIGSTSPQSNIEDILVGSDPVKASSPSRPGSTHVAVIGRSIRIDGDLRGEEDLKIDGDVNGTVQLRNNTLTIGDEGKISANVYAKAVTIDGCMDGDVFGFERVSIRKNAQVNGNITAPRVSLEDGAKFKGSIEMDPKAVEAAFGANAGASGATAKGGAPRVASMASGNVRQQAESGKGKNESLG